ncbi:hypothetical protein HDV06_000415 [Boothiomyces sp. JEL0866]|nr:hypothetical protein HDV06_000415 [Boothiomyces sp. JEL0866]
MPDQPLKFYSQCFSFTNANSTRKDFDMQKPLNSFFLYRKDKKQQIIKEYSIKKSHEISKKAAELWAKESKEVRQHYKKLSSEEHFKFKQQFPEYDWQPWLSRKGSLKRKNTLKILSWSSHPAYNVHKAWYLNPSAVNVSPDVYEATRLDIDCSVDIDESSLTSPTLSYNSIGSPNSLLSSEI